MFQFETEFSRKGALAQLSAVLSSLTGGLKRDQQSYESYLAATKVFLLRCAGAATGYAAHVVLARLLGQEEFGVFALAWIWVMMIGLFAPMGLSHAACRFVPQYFERDDNDHLRGFVHRGMFLTVLFGIIASLLAISVLWLTAPFYDERYLLPFTIALLVVPIFAAQDFVENLARSFNWVVLAIAPTYLIRNAMIGAGVLIAVLLGAPQTAWVAACVLFLAVAVCFLVQSVLVFRRWRKSISPGNRRYTLRSWFRTALALIFVDGTQLLFINCDILILSLFYDPATVAVYFAATRILQIAAFVPFSITAATAQRYSALDARQDKGAIQRLAQNATRFTVLSSLLIASAILALSPFLLGMFGPEYLVGIPVIAILLIGLVVQAAAGPGEDLLSMLGHERICAKMYLAALVFNAVLNVVLIPLYGIFGAAIATTISLSLRSLVLTWLVRDRININILLRLPALFGRSTTRPDEGIEEPNASNPEPDSRDPGFGSLKSPEPDRKTDGSIASGLIDRNQMCLLGEEWQNLERQCVEENAYLSWQYVSALLDHVDDNPHISAIAAYADGKLAGILPFVGQRWRWLGPGSVNIAWKTPYTPLATPLLHKKETNRIAEAMVDAMTRHSGQSSYWMLPMINVDGPASLALKGALRRRSLHFAEFDVFRRPVLDVVGSYEDHVRNHVPASRHRGLNRRRNKLSKQGSLTLVTFTSGPDLDEAVEMFLTLEASGWKGKARTALACCPRTQAFARQAFGSWERRSICRADVLCFNGSAIAVSLAVHIGKTYFFLKSTYDEAYRQFSPGLLLDQHILENVLTTGWAERLDSSADEDHVLSSLWNGFVRVGDLLICSNPDISAARFDFAVKRETAYRNLRSAAKTAYRQWTGRK